MTRKYVSNKDESVRIFRSGFLEWFSHVHPAVPHMIYIPIIGYMVYSSYAGGAGLGRIGLLFLAGMLFWTLTEYLVHRFVFHTTLELEEEVREIVGGLAPGEAALPKITTLRQKQYFLAHGVHHDFPNDSRRLVMPPSVSIPLAVAFYAAFRLLFGASDGPALFAGFTLTYLIYDTIHYAVHHFQLHGQVTLYLKKMHFRHHYADSTRDFGVSSPLWDLLLGTAGRSDR
jgi:4-hydroxysphinganine ceramide fatty acyl 2-hydroxylase